MIHVFEPTLMDLMKICHHARPDEIEQYEILVGKEWNFERVAAEHFNRTGVKFIILDDKTAIVAGGYDEIIPGVWQSWMVGSMDGWETHWRSITKHSRRIMQHLLDNGARRLQTCVLASREKTCEWYVRGLKMEFEGTMKNFGIHGEDMAMYARTAEK